MGQTEQTHHAHTNALAGETSPYLLQHAHNPVDWMPWGQAAFDKAQELDRPIFLSVGYSTCYWCHVMERGVFENANIASLMNDYFVCIKVDREERPDVDEVYMTATQVMTRRGGWPMSVFLTPPGAIGEGSRGLKPFFCGTYYPPEPTGGMPSFPQVLASMHNAWSTQREVVLSQADELADHVARHLQRKRTPGDLSLKSVQQAAGQLLQSYDREHGGFGAAPKFPTPNNLLFLLAVLRHKHNPQLEHALAHTLDRMARGGIFDQVAGGFHRYSVDALWLVPHFEKMLYDNGQLLEVYAEAHEAGILRPLAERVMRQTAGYVMREMTDATGAFFSAQDAEVNTYEGGSYLWTRRQVEEAIDDPELRDFAVKLYGLDRGPNFRDPHHPGAQPVNVLFLPAPLDQLGPDAAAKRDRVNAMLKKVRDQREQPATDDKVLAGWNGMMIAGLARAGQVLGERLFIDAAARAADAVAEKMAARGSGLYRSLRARRARIGAFLEDYAHFVHGLIRLHRATGDHQYQTLAARYTDAAIERFAAPGGGYFDTPADQGDLFVRVGSFTDGAVPCGASQTIHNLLDLGRTARAVDDLRVYARDLAAHGPAMAHMQHALLRAFAAAPKQFAAAPPPSPRPSIVAAAVAPADDQPGLYRVALTIAPGYHLNANPAPEGLTPTQLEPGEVTYPPGQAKRYPFADREQSVYEGTVTLEVKLDPADPPAQLTLTYQPCTDRACERPVRQTISLPQ